MSIFAAGTGTALMLLAGIALLIYVLMRKAYMQQEAQRHSRVLTELPVLPRQKPTWQTSDNSIELAEIARELNGQLTTKMIVIEQLIADSQKQIERMEELLERIEKARKES